MSAEPTREQEEYIDRLAVQFGTAKVRPLEGTQTLMVCGWVPGPEGEGGFRAEGSSWEWLDADGNHGPVDGVREALQDVVAAGEQARQRGMSVHEAIAAAATPEPAAAPNVPGPSREELAREALRQVATHWPDDLRGVCIRAIEPGLWQQGAYRLGAEVALLGMPDGVPLGLILRFTAAELRSGSPAVAQLIRREHREWKRKRGE